MEPANGPEGRGALQGPHALKEIPGNTQQKHFSAFWGVGRNLNNELEEGDFIALQADSWSEYLCWAQGLNAKGQDRKELQSGGRRVGNWHSGSMWLILYLASASIPYR